MRNWTTKEAKLVLEWARRAASERLPIQEIAKQLNRDPATVKEFLRRVLPKGHRPWTEKPRWAAEEIEALHYGATVPTRSPVAAKKYIKRHFAAGQDAEDDRAPLSVTQDQSVRSS